MFGFLSGFIDMIEMLIKVYFKKSKKNEFMIWGIHNFITKSGYLVPGSDQQSEHIFCQQSKLSYKMPTTLVSLGF